MSDLRSRGHLAPLLYALAGLLLLGGVALRAVSQAEAQSFTPLATGGSHPWVDFGGFIPANGQVTLYTVPADRIFVLSGISLPSSRYVDIYQDTTLKVSKMALATQGFGGNEGHLVFEPGTSIILESNRIYDLPYFVQGYLAHP